jgi:UDP-N-acetylglucosamine 4-epimerase
VHLTPSLHNELQLQSGRWLVTGAAGFIGSNLVEALLAAGQQVTGLDNYATGYRRNLEQVRDRVGADRWSQFQMIDADIRDRSACQDAVRGAKFVLHQAALGSVPRSLQDPLTTHDVNLSGFVNMLDAARAEGVERFVYAASSSTYGDEPNLPKREDRIGNPLSPYAATKLANEIYAAVYARSYGIDAIGLRYFNVFGPRQDPGGAYAAVVPKWVAAMIAGEDVVINGDGSTSRDFCYVSNAVQANVRAALAPEKARNQVFNVAVGQRTSLLELFGLLREELEQHQIHYSREPQFRDFRAGDVRHSQADIAKAADLLGYAPTHSVRQGLVEALPWYIGAARKSAED